MPAATLVVAPVGGGGAVTVFTAGCASVVVLAAPVAPAAFPSKGAPTGTAQECPGCPCGGFILPEPLPVGALAVVAGCGAGAPVTEGATASGAASWVTSEGAA